MNKFLTFLFILLAAGLCNKEPEPKPVEIDYKMDSNKVVTFIAEAEHPVSITGTFTDPDAIPQVEAHTNSSYIGVKAEVKGTEFTVEVSTLKNFTKDQEFTVIFSLGDIQRTETCTASMAWIKVERDKDDEPYWLPSDGGTLSFKYSSNLAKEQIIIASSSPSGYEKAVVDGNSFSIKNRPRDPGREYDERIYVCDMVGLEHDIIPVIIRKRNPAEDIYPIITANNINHVLIPNYENRVTLEYDTESPIVEAQARSSSGLDVRVDYESGTLLDYKLAWLYLTPNDNMADTENVTVRLKNSKGWGEIEIPFEKAKLTLSESSISVDSGRHVEYLTLSTNLDEWSRRNILVKSNKHFFRGELTEDGKVKVTIASNVGGEKNGELVVSDLTGNLAYSIFVTQKGYNAEDAGLTDKELRARDSVAVRKLLYAIHCETGDEWEQFGYRMSDPSYPITSWPGNIVVNYKGRVTVIRAIGVGDGKTPGYIPDEIGDLTELKQLEISQPLNKSVPESMRKCVKLKDLWLAALGLEGSLNCEPWQSLASHLKSIRLTRNNFTGSFPDWVADMPFVEGDGHEPVYWLNKNRLSGKVPECVSSTLHWNTISLDGSGQTYGQQNMEQQEGYVLYE